MMSARPKSSKDFQVGFLEGALLSIELDQACSLVEHSREICEEVFGMFALVYRVWLVYTRFMRSVQNYKMLQTGEGRWSTTMGRCWPQGWE
jgi:hypothetical protein